jgi:hypothetical protein
MQGEAIIIHDNFQPQLAPEEATEILKQVADSLAQMPGIENGCQIGARHLWVLGLGVVIFISLI